MKKEFRRRLIVLADAIFDALDRDSVHYGLLPALFSVFTYMWCKSDTQLSIKSKRKNHVNVSR